MPRRMLGVCLLALGACAPFVDTVNIASITPEERSAAATVRIFNDNQTPPAIVKTIGDVESYSCKHLVTSPPASKGNALQQLRIKANRMGANAVISVV